MKKLLIYFLLISLTIQAQNESINIDKVYSKQINRLAKSKIIKSSFDYIFDLE
ncbi:MAG: hypothetical protein ACI9E3_000471, partial [Flavobacteriales bacterium]